MPLQFLDGQDQLSSKQERPPPVSRQVMPDGRPRGQAMSPEQLPNPAVVALHEAMTIQAHRTIQWMNVQTGFGMNTGPEFDPRVFSPAFCCSHSSPASFLAAIRGVIDATFVGSLRRSTVRGSAGTQATEYRPT